MRREPDAPGRREKVDYTGGENVVSRHEPVGPEGSRPVFARVFDSHIMMAGKPMAITGFFKGAVKSAVLAHVPVRGLQMFPAGLDRQVLQR